MAPKKKKKGVNDESAVAGRYAAKFTLGDLGDYGLNDPPDDLDELRATNTKAHQATVALTQQVSGYAGVDDLLDKARPGQIKELTDLVAQLGFIPERSAEYADRLGKQVEQQAGEVQRLKEEVTGLQEKVGGHEEEVRRMKEEHAEEIKAMREACNRAIDDAARQNVDEIGMQVAQEMARLQEVARKEEEDRQNNFAAEVEAAVGSKLAIFEQGVAVRVNGLVMEQVEEINAEVVRTFDDEVKARVKTAVDAKLAFGSKSRPRSRVPLERSDWRARKGPQSARQKRAQGGC